jgi:hypothetical protein
MWIKGCVVFRGEELNYYSGECPLYNLNKHFTTESYDVIP